MQIATSSVSIVSCFSFCPKSSLSNSTKFIEKYINIYNIK